MERESSMDSAVIDIPSISPTIDASSPGRIVFRVSWPDDDERGLSMDEVESDQKIEEESDQCRSEEPSLDRSISTTEQSMAARSTDHLPTNSRSIDSERSSNSDRQPTDPSSKVPPRNPRGTYFRDDRRQIDYVLVYEERSNSRRSLTNTVQDLRRMARSSSHTLLANIRKLSTTTTMTLDHSSSTMSSANEIDEQRREFFLSQLLKCGLELEMHEYHEKSNDGGKKQRDRKLVFVKVHAPWEVIKRESERLRMKFPLNLVDDKRRVAMDGSEDGRLGICKRTFVDFSCLLNRPNINNNTDDDDPSSDFGRRIAWPFSNHQIERFDLSDSDGIVTSCRRSEIVWECLQMIRSDPTKEKTRGIESLLERGIFEAAFPLHDGDYEIRGVQSSTIEGGGESSRQRLYREWASIGALLRPQPLNRIRNYFSEKVAFYFAFMDFYSKMLIIPAVFGSLSFVYGLIVSWTNAASIEQVCDERRAPGEYVMCPICQPPACEPYRMAEEGCERAYWQYRLENSSTILISAFNLLWCVLFVKLWRRRESSLAVDWDTYDARDQVQSRVVRPDYEKKSNGRRKTNAITDESEPHVPKLEKTLRKCSSALITLAIVGAAASCLAILIVCRVCMYGLFKKLGGPFRERNVDVARWIQHGFMFVMVTLFEAFYHRVAEYLTKLECPKTTSGYSSSLLWKVFIFAQLVDFLPIAYAAWFKGRFWRTPKRLDAITEMCEAGGCMNEVVELVAVLLLLRLIVQNIAEVGWPTLKAAWARFRTKRRGVKRNMQDSVKHLTRWSQFLKDYHLNELKLDGVSPEYMEMIIQFSFVAFFVPALPLVPLICLINNIVEIRVDAINFLVTHRRPSPARVPGIQIWNKFLDIIVKLAVVVNAALLAFTSEIVPRIFHDSDQRHPHERTFAEYVNSSLSWQDVDEWPQLRAYVHERQSNPNELGGEGGEREDVFVNLTRCAYFGYRQSKAPYNLEKLFFQILTARLIAFAAFVVVFYFLIYLINSMIDDVPKSVRDRIKRRHYLVTKALEEEAGKNRQIGEISAQISRSTDSIGVGGIDNDAIDVGSSKLSLVERM